MFYLENLEINIFLESKRAALVINRLFNLQTSKLNIPTCQHLMRFHSSTQPINGQTRLIEQKRLVKWDKIEKS